MDEKSNCPDCIYWERYKFSSYRRSYWGWCNHWNENRSEFSECPQFKKRKHLEVIDENDKGIEAIHKPLKEDR